MQSFVVRFEQSSNLIIVHLLISPLNHISTLIGIFFYDTEGASNLLYMISLILCIASLYRLNFKVRIKIRNMNIQKIKLHMLTYVSSSSLIKLCTQRFCSHWCLKLYKWSLSKRRITCPPCPDMSKIMWYKQTLESRSTMQWLVLKCADEKSKCTLKWWS